MADSFNFPLDHSKERSSLIDFYSEGIDFQLSDYQIITKWIAEVVEEEKHTLGTVQYIFCSDDYLHEVNVEHLDHDYLTDIITFPYQESPVVEADLFISIDRVKDNAVQLGIPFEEELHRVMIHGILHLCGYMDKTEADIKEMRSKENEALARLTLLSSD